MSGIQTLWFRSYEKTCNCLQDNYHSLPFRQELQPFADRSVATREHALEEPNSAEEYKYKTQEL